jgi:hypothetical protein
MYCKDDGNSIRRPTSHDDRLMGFRFAQVHGMNEDVRGGHDVRGTPKQRVATADRPRTSLSFPNERTNDLTTDQSQIHRSYRGWCVLPTLSIRDSEIRFRRQKKKKKTPFLVLPHKVALAHVACLQLNWGCPDDTGENLLFSLGDEMFISFRERNARDNQAGLVPRRFDVSFVAVLV